MVDKYKGLEQHLPGAPREWVERLVTSDDNTDALAVPGGSSVPTELGMWRHTGLTTGTPATGEWRSDSLTVASITELRIFTVPESPGNNVAEMFNKFTGGESYITVYDANDFSQFYIFRMDEANLGILISPGATNAVTFEVTPVSGTMTTLSGGLYVFKVTGTASVSHILHTFNFDIASFTGTNYASYPAGDPYAPSWTGSFATAPTVDQGGIMLPLAGPQQNVVVSGWIRSVGVSALLGFTLTCWKIERTNGSNVTTVTNVSEVVITTNSTAFWYNGVDLTSGVVDESDLLVVGIKNHFGTAGGLEGQLVVKVV